ncbi:hypothetical protein ND440_11780 [Yersinia ruckeri]|uniref:hypothetical protein n=2 Tax=Yersinia ruckeri TaxID=29486 RepID=UPI0022645DF2|nr:hypothetical protein [Yersinia ruckeri]UZX64335.1 hypothetical protein ND440_11780 [Yersinia ruckeri]
MIHNNLSDTQQYRRAIYHELGHWLMGRHVGFDVGSIIIGKSNFGVFGNSEVKPIPKTKLESADAIYKHLFDRVCILCAGVISDIIWHKIYESEIDEKNDDDYFYSNGVMDSTGITDKGKIIELLFVMNGIVNAPVQDKTLLEKQMGEIQNKAWDRALKFLRNNQNLVSMGDELINQFQESQTKEFEKKYLIHLQENLS